MPVYDDIEIILEKGSNDDYTIVYTGNCKWSLDAYCKKMDSPIKVDVAGFIDEKGNLLKDVNEYRYYTLKDKSKIYNCEIEVFSEYEDYDYENDQGDKPLFEHYKNGKLIEKNNLLYNEIIEKAYLLFGVKIDIPNYYEDDDWYEEENDKKEELSKSIFPFTTKVVHTYLNGGGPRAENYKIGDMVKLVPEPDNPYDEFAVRVEHELGFVGYLYENNRAIISKLKESQNEEPLAKMVELKPLSQRSKKCKNPLVVIDVYLK